QALDEDGQRVYLVLVQSVQQVVFELQCQRCDLVVHFPAFLREVQDRTAAVSVRELPVDTPALDEFGDGPADGDLVHQRALRDFDRGKAGKAPENRDHPPLRNGEVEPLVISTGDRAAYGVGENGQAIRQEILQDEFPGASTRRWFFRFFGHVRVLKGLLAFRGIVLLSPRQQYRK